jgi:hypothetical protein
MARARHAVVDAVDDDVVGVVDAVETLVGQRMRAPGDRRVIVRKGLGSFPGGYHITRAGTRG